MIRITDARTHVKKSVSLFVMVSPRSEGMPIGIARRAREVILEAIEGLTQLSWTNSSRDWWCETLAGFAKIVRLPSLGGREGPVEDRNLVCQTFPTLYRALAA